MKVIKRAGAGPVDGAAALALKPTHRLTQQMPIAPGGDAGRTSILPEVGDKYVVAVGFQRMKWREGAETLLGQDGREPDHLVGEPLALRRAAAQVVG